MVKAIRLHTYGGPEVLTFEEVDLPQPASLEVQVRHSAIGLNYIDTYVRSGLYPVQSLPHILGKEAAGVVEAVGKDVKGFKVGDRVAYVVADGAYAEVNNVQADRLVKIPEALSDDVAAAAMLKGMTAQYLLKRTFPVQHGQTILFHAAAGGVGLVACAWAAALGAKVIGTVGSEAKAALARAHGCHHVINYNTENFVDRVREITQGKLCDVVYDSVGQSTFPGSLDCLRPLGMWVSFGQASGVVPPLNMALLAQKGSLFVTRPTLFSYIATHEDLQKTAADVFDALERGLTKVEVNQRFALRDAVQAHISLESRNTTGATVLLP